MKQLSFPTTCIAAVRETNDSSYREKPRQRIAECGAQALSDDELLACLIGISTAQAERILTEMGGWIGLMQADFAQLCNFHGISRAKAAQIKAALELGRRLLLAHHGERYQVKSPTDVAQLMQLEMAHLDQEHLRVISLDTKNRIQKIATVYVGNLNSAVIRVGEVFKEALKVNACSIVVVHNHPSSDPTPSPEDVLVTRQIVDAGTMLDVDVLDHIIIGKGRYVSLKERGLGFKP